MTTIVYKEGLLAADTRAYSGGPLPIGTKHKIRRLSDGSIAGVSTIIPGLSERFLDWLESGDEKDQPPEDKLNIQALVIKPNGNVFYFDGSVNPTGPLEAPFFAIGSGQEYALGALTYGATPVEAVFVASQHDVWTNDSIETIHLATYVDSQIAEKEKTDDC